MESKVHEMVKQKFREVQEVLNGVSAQENKRSALQESVSGLNPVGSGVELDAAN